MADQNSGGAEFFAGLVIGGLVGAALALLLAPQSGEETRAQLRDKSLEFKDRAEEGVLEARHRAQAQMAHLQEQVTHLQGQVAGLQEKGKETLEKSKQTAAEALEKGKHTASEAISRGKETVSQALNRGKDNAAEA
jgi:gas vesicle protein